jgi:hypothetical protein
MCLGKTNENKSKLQIFLEARYTVEGADIPPMAHHPFIGRQPNDLDDIRSIAGRLAWFVIFYNYHCSRH